MVAAMVEPLTATSGCPKAVVAVVPTYSLVAEPCSMELELVMVSRLEPVGVPASRMELGLVSEQMYTRDLLVWGLALDYFLNQTSSHHLL